MWKYIPGVSKVVDAKKKENPQKLPMIRGSMRRWGPLMWLKYDEEKGMILRVVGWEQTNSGRRECSKLQLQNEVNFIVKIVKFKMTKMGWGGGNFWAIENWSGRVHFEGRSPEWQVLSKFSVQPWESQKIKWNWFYLHHHFTSVSRSASSVCNFVLSDVLATFIRVSLSISFEILTSSRTFNK